MPKAVWEGAILAESQQTILVEGNHYFPPDSIHWQYLERSDEKTTCPWKGIASYYDIHVGGKVNLGGAWYYPEPKPAARQIKDHIAFWRGVLVTG